VIDTHHGLLIKEEQEDACSRRGDDRKQIIIDARRQDTLKCILDVNSDVTWNAREGMVVSFGSIMLTEYSHCLFSFA